MTDIAIERAREGDLAEILRNYERFWGDRDIPRYLNHPMFFLEFGDTAFVARDSSDDSVAGYLLGFIAPFVIDGAVDRLAFETYVEKILVPELRQGDVVIMDNLPGHKGPKVRQLIEAAGASLLYLPPYSPDFNPIENAFAKLKALLRKAAERTVEGLWSAIGQLIDLVTPQEIQNLFAAAGYDAS